MRPPVFVAGRGAMTPFGCGATAFVDAIFAGVSAIGPRNRFADVDCLTSVAAEWPAAMVAGIDAQGLPRAMAERAANEALDDARITDRGALGMVVASTKAEMSGIEGVGDGLGNPATLAARLAHALGIGGPAIAVSSACASGLAAIALATRWIETGRAPRVVVVGVDALCAFVLRGFSALLALDPVACRPFDVSRGGLTLGEAAGAIVLSGDPRDARYGRVSGCGESNDANHITGPSRDGRGLALAARRALDRAGVGPAEVALVHLHGTGTRFNDAMEGLAAAQVFAGVPVRAAGSKAQTGHTLGAAGVIESLIALEAMARRTAPPNLRLVESDVDPVLRLSPRAVPLEHGSVVLKLAAGFGGINAAVVFADVG